MHDLTSEINTYHHGDTHSKLDRVLGPISLLSNNHLHYTVSTETHWSKAGHDTVKVALRPRAAIEVSKQNPWHLTIPTSAFKLADAKSEYRQLDHGITDLRLQLAGCAVPTLYNMQSIF